jgi:hypothetical protein
MEVYGSCLAAEAPTILERGLRYMLGMDSRFPIFFVILSRPLGVLLLLHDGLGLEKERRIYKWIQKESKRCEYLF